MPVPDFSQFSTDELTELKKPTPDFSQFSDAALDALDLARRGPPAPEEFSGLSPEAELAASGGVPLDVQAQLKEAGPESAASAGLRSAVDTLVPFSPEVRAGLGAVGAGLTGRSPGETFKTLRAIGRGRAAQNEGRLAAQVGTGVGFVGLALTGVGASKALAAKASAVREGMRYNQALRAAQNAGQIAGGRPLANKTAEKLIEHGAFVDQANAMSLLGRGLQASEAGGVAAAMKTLLQDLVGLAAIGLPAGQVIRLVGAFPKFTRLVRSVTGGAPGAKFALAALPFTDEIEVAAQRGPDAARMLHRNLMEADAPYREAAQEAPRELPRPLRLEEFTLQFRERAR